MNEFLNVNNRVGDYPRNRISNVTPLNMDSNLLISADTTNMEKF